MNSNLNNTNSEHSYLCLVAIYAIHVVVFHVVSQPPPASSSSTTSSSSSSPSSSSSGEIYSIYNNNITVSPELQPMARWKINNNDNNNNSNNNRTLSVLKKLDNFNTSSSSSSSSLRYDTSATTAAEAATDYDNEKIMIKLKKYYNDDDDDNYDKNNNNNERKNSMNNQTIPGTEAYLGQFPHQVSLRRIKNGIHFCGGNIINDEWIVTAAHCMYSDNKLISPSTVKIYAGDILLNEISPSSQIRIVKKIIVHYNFDIRTLKNDIALLKLRSKLILDDVTVAAKALRNESLVDGTPCQVSGWGVTQYGTTVLSNELLYVDVPIINRTLCQQLMVSYSDIPQVMICAGHIEGGFDSCRGDSGGGLICNNLLTGLVSWGKECGLANFPGIYTNVEIFKYWILNIIEDENDDRSDELIYSNIMVISPDALGVFLGCLVFLFTFTDREILDNEIL